MTSPASTAAVELSRERDALVEEVTEGLLRRYPELRERFGERGVRATRDDVASHIDTVRAALDAGAPALFIDYARWLAGVLEPRGVPVAMLTASFTALADACRARLPGPAADAVARLLERGVAALPEAGGDVDVPAATPPGALAPGEPHSLIDPGALVPLLIAGRHREVERLLEERLGRGAYLDIAVNALQPALYEVGRRWQTNLIGVAEEHLATSTALHALTDAFVRAEAQPLNGRRAVFACVEGNLHDLGVRVLADAFELAGWQADALGANTPTRDLVAFVRERRPHLLGLSVSLPRQLARAREAIAAVREALGEAAPTIVIGGLAVNQLAGAERVLGADAAFPNARKALEGP